MPRSFFSFHHTKLPAYFEEQKKYHLAHQCVPVVFAYFAQSAGALTFGFCVPLASYNNFDLGYGVTSKIWDKVFGTELMLNKKEKNAMGL